MELGLLAPGAESGFVRATCAAGRWAHLWRDQSNILPLDLTIYFLTSFLIPLQISV
jgi:hypothetical protein